MNQGVSVSLLSRIRGWLSRRDRAENDEAASRARHRHPARGVPAPAQGPDDDPEFLAAVDLWISGEEGRD